MPATLGRITLVEGGAVWILMERVYGFVDNALLEAVAAANPNLPDLNRVAKGMSIQLPAYAEKANPLASDKSWVLLGKKSSVEEAYAFLRNYRAEWPAARMLPYWNRKEGLTFALILRQGYDREDAATEAIRSLPQPLTTEAKLLGRLDGDAVFFAR